jgi:hypothetical protein
MRTDEAGAARDQDAAFRLGNLHAVEVAVFPVMVIACGAGVPDYRLPLRHRAHPS